MFIRLSLFQRNSKIIATDLSKQQVLDADTRAIQHINFTVNLSRARNTTTFFIFEEAKETIVDFLQGTVIVPQISCTIFIWFNIISK